MITLSSRLRAVADLIPQGARVVDVGADHGRLPVFLIQRGIASRALATDARPEPLRRARRLFERCGLDNVIGLRQTNGLTDLPLGDFDIVVMAGLGADTIVDILRKNPPPSHVTCVLQPMSHAERLRDFLGESITAERIAQESYRLYNIITASSGEKNPIPPGRRYVSRALEHSGDPLLALYLNQQIARLTAELSGLAASHRPNDSIRRKESQEALAFLREMREN